MFSFASSRTYACKREVRDAYTSQEMNEGVLAAMNNQEEEVVCEHARLLFIFFFRSLSSCDRRKRATENKKEGEQGLFDRRTRMCLP